MLKVGRKYAKADIRILLCRPCLTEYRKKELAKPTKLGKLMDRMDAKSSKIDKGIEDVEEFIAESKAAIIK